MKFKNRQPVGGGCIHRCYRVAEGFLKVNDASMADAFAAEADGLAALRGAGCSAPEPIEHGIDSREAYLLMQWLELRSRGDFAALGRMLAQLHESTGPGFGWTRDNYIGSTPQQNRESQDWPTFWREQRLEPQIELARRNGHRIDIGGVCDLLEGHAPPPSLVHGDLWSGNVGFLADGSPVLFDPAVYYGDAEVDLAMTELFGGGYLAQVRSTLGLLRHAL